MIYTTPKPICQRSIVRSLVLALLGICETGSAAGMDPTAKWAWSTNAGWINFNPTVGGDVAVFGDHLEGYIWSGERRLDKAGDPHRR